MTELANLTRSNGINYWETIASVPAAHGKRLPDSLTSMRGGIVCMWPSSHRVWPRAHGRLPWCQNHPHQPTRRFMARFVFKNPVASEEVLAARGLATFRLDHWPRTPLTADVLAMSLWRRFRVEWESGHARTLFSDPGPCAKDRAKGVGIQFRWRMGCSLRVSRCGSSRLSVSEGEPGGWLDTEDAWAGPQKSYSRDLQIRWGWIADCGFGVWGLDYGGRFPSFEHLGSSIWYLSNLSVMMWTRHPTNHRACDFGAERLHRGGWLILAYTGQWCISTGIYRCHSLCNMGAYAKAQLSSH